MRADEILELTLHMSTDEVIEFAKTKTLSIRKLVLECGMSQYERYRSDQWKKLNTEWERVMDFIQDRNM